MLSDVSLPPACQAFRSGFPDAVDERHLAVCPSCAAWAVHRDVVALARETKRDLPPALAGRLRAIPRQVKACPDAESLVRAARDEARGQSVLPAVSAHLSSCARCSELLAVLTTGFAEPAHRLPRALTSRLQQIGPKIARRGLVWAFDLRAASVAALLMGMLLLPVAEPTAALVRQAGNAFAEPIAGWRMPEGRRSGDGTSIAAAIEPIRENLVKALGEAGDKLSSYVELWVSLTVRTRSTVERVLSLRATEHVGPDARAGEDDHDDR